MIIIIVIVNINASIIIIVIIIMFLKDRKNDKNKNENKNVIIRTTHKIDLKLPLNIIPLLTFEAPIVDVREVHAVAVYKN